MLRQRRKVGFCGVSHVSRKRAIRAGLDMFHWPTLVPSDGDHLLVQETGAGYVIIDPLETDPQPIKRVVAIIWSDGRVDELENPASITVR